MLVFSLIRFSDSLSDSVVAHHGGCGSPARLLDARNAPLVGKLPEADPARTELPVHGPRAATEHAPADNPRGVLGLSLRRRDLRFACHDSSVRAAVSMPVVFRAGRWPGGRYAAASPSFLRGMPIATRNCRASSSLRAVVTNVMFIPCGRVNLSGLISGKTICSDRPRL